MKRSGGVTQQQVVGDDWQPLDDSNFFKENELLGGGAKNQRALIGGSIDIVMPEQVRKAEMDTVRETQKIMNLKKNQPVSNSNSRNNQGAYQSGNNFNKKGGDNALLEQHLQTGEQVKIEDSEDFNNSTQYNKQTTLSAAQQSIQQNQLVNLQRNKIEQLEKANNSLRNEQNRRIQVASEDFAEISDEAKQGKETISQILKQMGLLRRVFPETQKIGKEILELRDEQYRLKLNLKDMAMRAELNHNMALAKSESRYYVDKTIRNFEQKYEEELTQMKVKMATFLEQSQQIVPKREFIAQNTKLHEFEEDVEQLKRILMGGFKRESKLILEKKLDVEEATELFEEKYNKKEALTVENTIFEQTEQIQNLEQELENLRANVTQQLQDQDATMRTKLQDMMKLAAQSQQKLPQINEIQSENTQINLQPQAVQQSAAIEQMTTTPGLPTVGELESPPAEFRQQNGGRVDSTKLVTPLDFSKLNQAHQQEQNKQADQQVPATKMQTTTDLLAQISKRSTASLEDINRNWPKSARSHNKSQLSQKSAKQASNRSIGSKGSKNSKGRSKTIDPRPQIVQNPKSNRRSSRPQNPLQESKDTVNLSRGGNSRRDITRQSRGSLTQRDTTRQQTVHTTTNVSNPSQIQVHRKVIASKKASKMSVTYSKQNKDTGRPSSRISGTSSRASYVHRPAYKPRPKKEEQPATKKKAQGIAGVLAQCKDLEERLTGVEDFAFKTDSNLGNLSQNLSQVKHKGQNTSVKMGNLKEIVSLLSDKVAEMTGGANNMGTFIQSVTQEKERVRKQLNQLTSKLTTLTDQFYQDHDYNSKIIAKLDKKSLIHEKEMRDVQADFARHSIFKKKQIDQIGNDVDDLLLHKAEYKKKADFLFEKMVEVSESVQTKTQSLLAEFNKVKSPIMNTVTDMGEAAALYHQEISRTQNINRDLLLDLNQIKSEYQSLQDKAATHASSLMAPNDFNASTVTGAGQLLLPNQHQNIDFAATSTISGISRPNFPLDSAMNHCTTSQQQQYNQQYLTQNAQNNQTGANQDQRTFMTSVSRHFESTGRGPADGFSIKRPQKKPQTQGQARRNHQLYHTRGDPLTHRPSLINNNNNVNERQTTNDNSPVSAKQAAELMGREKSAYEKMIKRRVSNAPRVKDQFGLWATTANDSIISQSASRVVEGADVGVGNVLGNETNQKTKNATAGEISLENSKLTSQQLRNTAAVDLQNNEHTNTGFDASNQNSVERRSPKHNSHLYQENMDQILIDQNNQTSSTHHENQETQQFFDDKQSKQAFSGKKGSKTDRTLQNRQQQQKLHQHHKPNYKNGSIFAAADNIYQHNLPSRTSNINGKPYAFQRKGKSVQGHRIGNQQQNGENQRRNNSLMRGSNQRSSRPQRHHQNAHLMLQTNEFSGELLPDVLEQATNFNQQKMVGKQTAQPGKRSHMKPFMQVETGSNLNPNQNRIEDRHDQISDSRGSQNLNFQSNITHNTTRGGVVGYHPATTTHFSLRSQSIGIDGQSSTINNSQQQNHANNTSDHLQTRQILQEKLKNRRQEREIHLANPRAEVIPSSNEQAAFDMMNKMHGQINQMAEGKKVPVQKMQLKRFKEELDQMDHSRTPTPQDMMPTQQSQN